MRGRPGIRIGAIALAVLFTAPAVFPFEPETRLDGPTEAERREIEQAIERNVARLGAEGALAAPTGGSVSLDFPLRQAAGFADPGFYFTTNFVDHDPQQGELLDYQCGDRTTDATVAHRGTDFAVWPFPWLKMQVGQVEVVSAAAGTIVHKQDGSYDQNCSCQGTWNAVYVRHADGSTAWYGHLKKNSTTSKGIGETVAAGEYLGLVGSSGCSSAPHLHFELYDGAGNLQDPYGGPCNGMNSESWWLEQPPYHDSALQKIVIGMFWPTLPSCPVTESTNDQRTFVGGQTARFTTYFRDLLAGQQVHTRLLRPDNSVAFAWNYTHPASLDYSTTAQTSYSYEFPLALAGTWTFTVEYLGIMHVETFQVDAIAPLPAGRIVSSLRVGKPTVEHGLPLTWEPSCRPNTQYTVFSGYLGDWYSHYPVSCLVDALSYDVDLIPHVQGNRYYLVVPRNSTAIGSFGLDSSGQERPPGWPVCGTLVPAVACSGGGIGGP